jgi:hypothetical protein
LSLRKFEASHITVKLEEKQKWKKLHF